MPAPLFDAADGLAWLAHPAQRVCLQARGCQAAKTRQGLRTHLQLCVNDLSEKHSL